MIDKILNHPAIPAGYTRVATHSNFGNQIGHFHYINETTDAKQTYYLSLLLEERHGGAPGRVHGGVTMTILDELMGRAASHTLGTLCFTATMTTNFCAAAKPGDFVLATANVLRHGKNLVFVESQLHANEKIIATASGAWLNSKIPIPALSKDVPS